jgi:hypothetical protein
VGSKGRGKGGEKGEGVGGKGRGRGGEKRGWGEGGGRIGGGGGKVGGKEEGEGEWNLLDSGLQQIFMSVTALLACEEEEEGKGTRGPLVSITRCSTRYSKFLGSLNFPYAILRMPYCSEFLYRKFERPRNSLYQVHGSNNKNPQM